MFLGFPGGRFVPGPPAPEVRNLSGTTGKAGDHVQPGPARCTGTFSITRGLKFTRLRRKLVALKPRNKNRNLSFVVSVIPGETWPRDSLQRVRLETWCRTHLKLAPETNYKAMSWPFPGLAKNLN